MYSDNTKEMARKITRMYTGDLFAMEYPVEFVSKADLTKGKLLGGPWFNCVALVETPKGPLIRGTNGK